MSSRAGIGVVCATNVVASVSITLVNRWLMSDGAISSRLLTFAQSAATAAATLLTEPAGVWAQPPRGLAVARLVAYVVACVSGITLWNRGLGGASVGSYQVFKLVCPAWAAVVQAALLGQQLTAHGWGAVLASIGGLALALSTGEPSAPRATASDAATTSPAGALLAFAGAALLSPLPNVLISLLRNRDGIGHAALVAWGAVGELAVGALLVGGGADDSFARVAAARDDDGWRAARMLALSCALALVMRHTTLAVSATNGGPTMYAVLSSLKATAALCVARVMLNEAATVRQLAGLAVCLMSSTVFVLHGRRDVPRKEEAKRP